MVLKKDDFTATCKLCNNDINLAHMGYSALTQHSEKKKHKGFALMLEKVKDHEKVKELEKSKSKECQKVLQDFVNQVSVPQNPKNEVRKVVTLLRIRALLHHKIQPKNAKRNGLFHSWLLIRNNSCFTVCFTKFTLQLCRCTPGMLQATVSRLCNCKTCCSGTKEDVIYGGLWFRAILQQKIVRDRIDGHSYFTFHFDETVSA